MANNKSKTSVRIPANQLDKLNKIKAEQGISINFLIRRGINWVLSRYQEEEKKKDENNSTNPKS